MYDAEMDVVRFSFLLEDYELVKHILKRNPASLLKWRSGEDQSTALHHAVLLGLYSTVKLLLQYGAFMDARTSQVGGPPDRTPLHLAAKDGHLPIIKLLLNAGADPSVQDMEGATPLDEAAMSGHCGAVEALLDAGVDVSNCTPLMHAVCCGHLEVTRLLLDRGVEVDTRDHAGTCLFHAAWNGAPRIVQLLLARGASWRLQPTWVTCKLCVSSCGLLNTRYPCCSKPGILHLKDNMQKLWRCCANRWQPVMPCLCKILFCRLCARHGFLNAVSLYSGRRLLRNGRIWN